MKRLINMSTQWLTGIVLGTALLVVPAAQATVLSVPQSATCQPPNPPIINGDQATICRGQQAELTAAGCTGTVIWSTGERGSAIHVSPHQTTRYTAVCRLADGCVSCFAEAFTVAVGTPNAPTLLADNPVICVGDAVTISTTGCTGVLTWSNPSLTGNTILVHPAQTTTYQATCQQGRCVGPPSALLTVTVAPPTTPLLRVVGGQSVLCAGQPISIEALFCAGQVHWSDGQLGQRRNLVASQSVRLRAVCQLGSCQSDSSAVLLLPVQRTQPTALAQTVVQNACPFQTADLTRAIGGAFDNTLTYEFRTSVDPTAAAVGSPGAVLAGVYYVTSRPDNGCSSSPVAVSALISTCTNAIAPCLSNPATASLRLDTLDAQRGLVCLQARLRGADGQPLNWTCTGSGLLTDGQTMRPRYVASEADHKTGVVIFVLTTPDPDGAGPCTGALARLTVDLSKPYSLTLIKPKPDSLDLIGQPEASTVFIPEGFSPNDDGVNDLFVIRGVAAGLTVQLDVFNRWGNQVYTANPYHNDWDGTANQGIMATNDRRTLPDGTYFYVVKISDGREFVRFMTIAH